jgi:cytochrome c-type biogenesis protein CcsB
MRQFVTLFYQWLISMKTALFLLILLAAGSAIATFIENDFGTPAARALVYNHWWFEGVLLLLGVALVGNIIRFKMWRKEKLPVFLFHASILLILIGAAMTRHLGYEGIMNIREGQSSSTILSEEAHIKIASTGLSASWPVLLTPVTGNDFHFSANLGGGAPVTIEYKDFYANAAEAVLPDAEGSPFLSLVASTGGKPIDVDLFEGEYMDFGVGVVGFGNDLSFEQPAVIIGHDQGQLTVRSHSDITRIDMDTQERTTLRAHTFHPFEERALYTTLEGLSLVFRSFERAASKQVVPVNEKTGVSAVVTEVSFRDEAQEVTLMGGSGMRGRTEQVELAGRPFDVAYGSARIDLPFSIYLDRFVLDRYPGSNSPSSYESHVVVKDPENGVEMPYHIYMNHILTYGGYRFYQSSYDQDEKGTILSVSRDPGLIPTYAGYLLVSVGFFLALFSSKGRFRKLSQLIQKDRKRHLMHTLGGLFLAGALALTPTPGLAEENTTSAMAAQAQQAAQEDGSPKEAIIGLVPRDHAEKFGRLLVQDSQGRVKPMDTLSLEVLHKIARADRLEGLSATQVVLGMISAPQAWQRVKMVRLTHPGIGPMLGLEEGARHAALFDFFHDQEHSGNPYKLSQAVEEASRTPQSGQSKLQKELIKVDERANVAYMTYQGHLLRVIPVRNDPNYTWISPIEMLEKLEPKEAQEAARVLYEYLNALRAAQQSGEWAEADVALEKLKEYQHTYGAAVMPSQMRVEAERLLNSLNPFDRLTPYYFLLGLTMLIFAFWQVLRPVQSKMRDRIWLGLSGLLFVLFVLHTFGLGLRWYVAGHAPWSNGYESMIYIAWTAVLAGFIFGRKSLFSLPVTAILAGFGLFVAHLSWMDPQITTLIPVLKSHWLTIHVSVISASYGFLAMSALLGFLSLCLFLFRRGDRPMHDYAIREMTRINEMSMIVGLMLLTVGNIFGAVWANESWGRYWSWDPKETWTLVSMLVYAAILHFRFVPHLKSAYTFALSSLAAYSVIIMTYFGVNYFLAGMHSYAGGDPMPVPSWVLPALLVVLALGAVAWFKRDDRVALER